MCCSIRNGLQHDVVVVPLAGVFGYDVKGNHTRWENALVNELGRDEVLRRGGG
jgi:hypothetical protein